MTSTTRHTVRLEGCAATPLANYLKALGVFRIVAEQKDPGAMAWWEAGVLCLRSILDSEEAISFFTDEYSPTAVIAPWNGGSGFHPGEDRNIIESMRASSSMRFCGYREAIQLALQALDELELPLHDKELFKAALKDEKKNLLLFLRNTLPQDALSWLDAAVLLGTNAPQYPPLLGTGGNDGRLEFTNNFMQRLSVLFDLRTGTPYERCNRLLDGALFAASINDLPKKKAIGQFNPGAAGGVNMTCSYEADPVNNPWDYVLMIEGTLMFAAASVKRMDTGSRESLSYPFCVRTSSAAYGSAAIADEENSRAELWAPLWSQATTVTELRALLSEGRAQVNKINAARGVDFARAIATLGIDRGIDSFRRFGFQERNGLAYLAVDLGRWPVAERRVLGLLTESDGWVERFRRCAKGKNAPKHFGVALQKSDEAIMDACRAPKRLTTVLITFGNIEQSIIQSPKATEENHLSPLPKLSVAWLNAADDGSPEFRLACALASIRGAGQVGSLRANMIPCDPIKPWCPYESGQMNKPHVVWRYGNLVDNLIAVLRRRCMDAARFGLAVLPLEGARPAPLQDILAFIRGDVDEKHIEELLWGLNAVDWRSYEYAPIQGEATSVEVTPPAYALLKLTHAAVRPDGTFIRSDAPGIPYDPAILAQAAAGRAEATRTAARRLKASGWKPLIDIAVCSPEHMRRCAAAALFPISRSDHRRVMRNVIHFQAMHES